MQKARRTSVKNQWSRLSILISRRRTASPLSRLSRTKREAKLWMRRGSFDRKNHPRAVTSMYSLLASFLSRLTRLNNCRLSGWLISSFRWEIGRVWMISSLRGIRVPCWGTNLSLREILSPVDRSIFRLFTVNEFRRRIVESLFLLLLAILLVFLFDSFYSNELCVYIYIVVYENTRTLRCIIGM